MENLRHWEALKEPPETALKKIEAGRLKGKTDISPQWRLKALTERFGPVGIGWKYEIVKLWIEEGENEKLAFSQINLYFKEDGEWSEPIPGIGGSMLTAQETRGPHNSDEAYKMATTDALSVAMKTIGVASDIYMGLWDGSKFNRVSDEDLLTFGDAVNYPDLIVGVGNCSDMAELKNYFTEQMNTLGSDSVGRAVLAKLSGYKKSEFKKV